MNTAVNREDWVGRVIDGKFRLLRWLGGSGRGEVFLTELPENQSQGAAIKLTRAETTGAEAQITVFAETTALSHPHLICMFHAGRCEINSVALIYVVMEYAEEDLSQIIPERPLTPAEATEMLAPVLDALTYLHGRGVAHGHLKPSNIMVVDNQVKISSDRLCFAGEHGMHPTPATLYDAPEAAQTMSPAADVWSLGVTLVEALTQHPPVRNGSTDARPIVPNSIPQPFAGIVKKCLCVDPARRCTPSDVQARLDDPTPLPQAVNAAKQTLFPKRPALAIGVAALVVLAVAGTVKLRSRTAPPPVTAVQHAAPLASRAPEVSNLETRASKGGLVKGAVAERVLPEVPRSARQTIQGKIKVVVRVQVDPSGGVSRAQLDLPGPSSYFANLALHAARSWKFRPAQVDGRAVSSIWILRFRFGRRTTEVSPVEAASSVQMPIG